jgi:hypothetical protein
MFFILKIETRIDGCDSKNNNYLRSDCRMPTDYCRLLFRLSTRPLVVLAYSITL